MASTELIKNWYEVEQSLQPADIIFVHGKGHLFRAIQERGNSYWNHTALVLQPPRPELGIRGAFIIGAIDGGIEIHRLRKYSERRDKFDIGVKRLPGLTDEVRKKVLSYLLNKLDAPYDFTRLFGYLFEGTLQKMLPEKSFKKVRRAILTSRPNSFVCSTFIQHAFHEPLPIKMQEKTLVRKDLHTRIELEEVTPADLAHSPNYEWIFNPHD